MQKLILSSYGYKQAKSLAQAIVATFETAQTQLISQAQYDFSLRALKTVLSTANIIMQLQNNPPPKLIDKNEEKKEEKKEESKEENKEENKEEPKSTPEVKEVVKEEIIKEKPKILDEVNVLKKALEDTYLPRLNEEDSIIFEHILTDQFPTAKPQATIGSEDEFLERCLKTSLTTFNLQENPSIIMKLHQLNDALFVHHGIIVLGPNASGKSSLIKAMQFALSIYSGNINESKTVEAVEKYLASPEAESRLITRAIWRNSIHSIQKLVKDSCHLENRKYIKLHWISPQAVNTQDLYGELDTKKKVWKEGIISHLVRKSIVDSLNQKYWIVMDGDMDNIWVEGLYSALEENRRLCLSSSECLLLPQDCSLFFETDTLSYASPATISRCGIIKTLESDLTWVHLLDSWSASLPPLYKEKRYTELFNALFRELLTPIFSMIWNPENPAKLVVPASSAWGCRSFTKLFECFLLENTTREQLEIEHKQLLFKQARLEAYQKIEGIKVEETSPRHKKAAILTIKQILEITDLFLLSIIWSLLTIVDDQSKNQVTKYILEKFRKLKTSNESALEQLKDAETAFPPDDIPLTSLFLKKDVGMWGSFKENVTKIDYSKEQINFQGEGITIPTEDTCKYTWIINSLAIHHMNVILFGNASTGKSIIMKQVMKKSFEDDKWVKLQMQMTGKTCANTVQEQIFSKFEKRVKNEYAPKAGQKLIIYLDDAHLPSYSNRRLQQPIELIREIICHRGIYDLKQIEFKEMLNFQIACSLSLTQGKINTSGRFSRHFSAIQVFPMKETDLHYIFSEILEWGFTQYEDDLKKYIEDIATLTLKIYQKVKESFLPVPWKCHYRFSLKDLIKLIQGMVAIPQSVYNDQGEDPDKKLRFCYKTWIHESMRVFSDKLANYQDRDYFENFLKTIADTSKFVIDWPKIVAKPSSLIYGKVEGNIYKELSLPFACDKIKDTFQEYTRIYKRDVNLVLYETVVQQILQITRLLEISKGHGLLIGLGGNGRSTLTKIACLLLNWKFATVGTHRHFRISEWRENLRIIYKQMGSENKNTVFLCSDEMLEGDEDEDDPIIEDIHNLLSSGEIPGLFSQKDKDELLSDRKHKTFEDFMRDNRSKLRLMICMNPVSKTLTK